MNLFIKSGIAAMLCAAAASAHSAPAPAVPRVITQPDGSTVTLTLFGDAAFHCWLTPEGYVASEGEDGFFRYVDNDGRTTQFIVGQGVPASIDANLSFDAYKAATTRAAFLGNASAASSKSRVKARIDKLGNSKWDNTDGHDIREVNTEGELRVLVVLANFTDQQFSVSSDPRQTIDDMLNKPGFDEYNATGSVFDYYNSVSAGQFFPKFDVYGPVNVSRRHIDYVSGWGETYINGDGKETAVYAPGRLVEEVVQALDGEINFADYDANGDGLVDFIYVFHAGQGATTGGGTNRTIWPHAFTLESAIGAGVDVDGVTVNRYAMSCELNNRTLMGAGMFCHEFSHVLGMPDLYDTANNNGTASQCFTPGTFSNMDAGNYNNDAHTSPTFSGYERYAMEWMKPVEINAAADLTILPLTARNLAYKVPTQNAQEYFIFEARAPQSYDTYLEGHGLAVWHIDFDLGIWQNNTVNNTAAHQRIDLLEADAILTTVTRDGDLFPGSQSIHELVSNIEPTFIDWNRRKLDIELERIMAHPDGTVTLSTTGSKKAEGFDLAAPAPRLTAMTAETASLEWAPVEEAIGYMISVYDMDSLKDGYYRTFLDGYLFKDLEHHCYAEIDGLEPGVNYGATVYALSENNASRSAHPVCFKAMAPEFENALGSTYAAYDADGQLVLGWDEIPGATHYNVTVATRAAAETAETVTCDFTDRLMPEGWSGTGAISTNSRYFGEASPSYQFTSDASYIRTAVYDRDINAVSFWHKISFTEDGVALDFYGTDTAGNVRFLKRFSDFNTKGETVTVELPAGYRQVTAYFSSNVSGLNLYIDDVTLSLADAPTDTPVAGYDARREEGTSLVLTGLENDTEYVAYVQPMTGDKAGLTTIPVYFTPSATPTGVDETLIPSGSAFGVAVQGGVLVPTDAEAAYDVYTVDGRVIASGARGSISLPARGIYIVAAEGKSVKVIY